MKVDENAPFVGTRQHTRSAINTFAHFLKLKIAHIKTRFVSIERTHCAFLMQEELVRE